MTTIRRSLAAIGLAVAFVPVLAAAALGASRTQPTAPITVAPSAVPAELAALGIHAPAGSCFANPLNPGCPTVTKVVISPPVTGGYASYGPPSRSGQLPPFASPTRRTATAQEDFACAVTAKLPTQTEAQSSQGVVYWINGEAENYCEPGVGVTYQSITAELNEGTPSDYWQMASEFDSSAEPGLITAVAELQCSEPLGPTEDWFTSGLGYAVVEGVGYSAVDNSPINELPC